MKCWICGMGPLDGILMFDQWFDRVVCSECKAAHARLLAKPIDEQRELLVAASLMIVKNVHDSVRLP